MAGARTWLPHPPILISERKKQLQRVLLRAGELALVGLSPALPPFKEKLFIVFHTQPLSNSRGACVSCGVNQPTRSIKIERQQSPLLFISSSAACVPNAPHANDAALTNFPIGAAPIKNNMLLRANSECINVVPRAEREKRAVRGSVSLLIGFFIQLRCSALIQQPPPRIE